MAAQQALLSSVDRELPPEAQQQCEGPDEGITLGEQLPCLLLVLLDRLTLLAIVLSAVLEVV